MAIFLLMDRDHTHPDPVKDARGCYKKGMIVQVFEDTQPCVIPPAEPFYIVKVTGLSMADALAYVQATLDGETVTRRRKYKVNWDLLPKTVQKALVANRYYETTWAIVSQVVKDIKTGTVVG